MPLSGWGQYPILISIVPVMVALQIKLFNSHPIVLMNKAIVTFFLMWATAAQVCDNSRETTKIDFAGSSKKADKNMNALDCNAQTDIDFTFAPSASENLTVTLADSNYNLLQFPNNNNGGAKLQFLDVNGNNRSYSLTGISLAQKADRRVDFDINDKITHQLSFTYSYQDSSTATKEDTILVVYLAKDSSLNLNTSTFRNMIGRDSSEPNGVGSFRDLVSQVYAAVGQPNGTNSTISHLSGALEPFRNMDYGKFYTVQSDDQGCRTNFLISAFVYNLQDSVIPNPVNTITYNSSFKGQSFQSGTGDLLCYGSHNRGIFQTHMRQSYPLWAAWFGALLFWVAILFPQHNTLLSLYDRKFQQNKWTSWEIYSLFHLAHEQFFTRMMRTISVYLSYTICCLVTACLYGELGNTYTDPVTILWIGVIGGVCGFIFSFPLGFFLQGEYYWTLEKYNIKRKIKALQDKESIEAQTFEGEIDKCEDRIYTYYYWYYVFCVSVLFVCWAISVHEMQKLPRQLYRQMWYWIGSVGVGFVLNVFVICPIMTALFGNYEFYQYRGFWYNYELGQAFKDVQDN